MALNAVATSHLNMSRTPIEQIEEAEVLAREGDLGFAESLLEALGRAPQNWVVRLKAAQALARLELRHSAANVLRALIREYAPNVQRRAPCRAALMLGDLGHVEEAAAVLARHCCTAEAVEGLVRFGHTHALKIVAAEAPNLWIRREAASALCQSGEYQYGLAALSHLTEHHHEPAEDHSDFTLRLASAEVLASFGHDLALRRLAHDVSLGLLRVFAAIALAEYGDPSTLKALSEHEEGGLRTSALGALRWLEQQTRQ